jgi:hypothetical protein
LQHRVVLRFIQVGTAILRLISAMVRVPMCLPRTDNYRINWSHLSVFVTAKAPKLGGDEMKKLLTLMFAVAVALSLSMSAMADENGGHHHGHHKHHHHHRKHQQ